MTDLPARLRAAAYMAGRAPNERDALLREAAAEIQRLTEELAGEKEACDLVCSAVVRAAEQRADAAHKALRDLLADLDLPDGAHRYVNGFHASKGSPDDNGCRACDYRATLRALLAPSGGEPANQDTAPVSVNQGPSGGER